MTARRAAAILLAVLAASCGSGDSDEVRVFAASSLADVMKTIAADFEQSTGAKVTLNLASSSVLAKQIVEGAPCDVFLSADQEWADFVEKEGMVEPGTRRDLLTNRLALVFRLKRAPDLWSQPREPGDMFAELMRRAELRVAMGDPSHVPAGKYARTALQALKVWDAVEGRAIPCESVRAALALVERDEADVGIVYLTDVLASKAGLQSVSVPEVATVDIRYPVLGVNGIGARGRAFLEFLWERRGTPTFRAAGFGVPSTPR